MGVSDTLRYGWLIHPQEDINMPNRDEVIAKLKDQLDVLNTKMADLEAKADAASGDAKAEYEKRMRHLNEMAQPAKDKFSQLKNASEDQWDRTMAVHLKGTFNCTQAVLPIMKRIGGGKIINVAGPAACR